jgi:hypothetical protein
MLGRSHVEKIPERVDRAIRREGDLGRNVSARREEANLLALRVEKRESACAFTTVLAGLDVIVKRNGSDTLRVDGNVSDKNGTRARHDRSGLVARHAIRSVQGKTALFIDGEIASIKCGFRVQGRQQTLIINFRFAAEQTARVPAANTRGKRASM